MKTADAIRQLCLACGLCCNGVLFRDVKLQPGDDAAGLKALGLPLRRSRSAARGCQFAQPCAALCADNRCRLYTARPARCREFECGLLKEVIGERLGVAAALAVVKQASRKADRVRSLLRQLGDHDEHRPLSQRFRRMRHGMECRPLEEELAERFAELTMEVHQLNLLIHSRFYTAPPSPQ